MVDATNDPEPSDKRTNEWKAWNSRQAKAPVVETAPARVHVMPDPNIFGAAFLAGMEAGGFIHGGDAETRSNYVMEAWHAHRLFIDKVNRADDVRLYEEKVAREKAIIDKKAAVEAADKAAEEARIAKRIADFGAKNLAPALATK